MQKSYFSFLLVSTVVILAFSACAPSEPLEPTLDVNEIVQQVAATLQMGYTQTAQAMPTATDTPEPTITPIPSFTLEPLNIATPTLTFTPTLAGPTPLPIDPSTAYGCYNAALVTDVTVPAGSNYKAGASFTKTWRLINTGTCDWTSEFKIAYVGGNLFGSDTTKIRQRVPVGGIADISLNMVAPSGLSGTVVSNWQMATDDGNLFGPVLAVSILLPGSNPTATDVGCYRSELESQTINPGAKMAPGEEFKQIWTIKNTGTCDWSREFRIEHVGGYDFEGADPRRIPEKVPAGSTVVIPMSVTSPNVTEITSYSSSWRLSTDDGVLFGEVFTIDIKVRP